jgi:hypothetical protein
MTNQTARSAAFDNALQNAGHALMLPDPVPALARVLAQFRDEHRAEVLAEAADRVDNEELPHDYVDMFDNGARWAARLLRHMAAGPAPAAVSAAVAPPTNRAAVRHEVADELTRKANQLTERVHDLAYFVAKDRLREAEILDREAAELRRMADETATETPEDPARIDRLRPEFTEHASVEAIDAQLDRARRQERRWHLRAEWLIGLRQARADQPAAGARQDGAES